MGALWAKEIFSLIISDVNDLIPQKRGRLRNYKNLIVTNCSPHRSQTTDSPRKKRRQRETNSITNIESGSAHVSPLVLQN